MALQITRTADEARRLRREKKRTRVGERIDVELSDGRVATLRYNSLYGCYEQLSVTKGADDARS